MWNHDPRKALGYKMKYQFDSELLDGILKGWFQIKWYAIDFGSFSTNCCLNSEVLQVPRGMVKELPGNHGALGPLNSVNKLH